MAKLRHIAISVADPHKSAEFYMKAFGMKKVGETDWSGARGVYLSDGTINLALLNYKSDQMAGEWRGREFVGLHHLGFWVDDVAASKEAVEAAGGQYWMGEAVEDGGFYEIKYRDPDGVVVDITANGWGGAVKDVVAAVDNTAARAAANEPSAAGKSGTGE
jgi:catechol 2,3-dioxygenase-like lactoylglutathione lyase family enzyme